MWRTNACYELKELPLSSVPLHPKYSDLATVQVTSQMTLTELIHVNDRSNSIYQHN